LCVRPNARCPKIQVQRLDPPYRVGKENDMDVNTITNKKPSRVTEMQVGDTLFTVVSVESDRARERLYDKVKRMILNNETTETPATPTAA
jgi:hypothetical protein